MKENRNNKKNIGLLPNYYKKIGVLIMILAIVPAIIIKTMNIEIVQSQTEIFKMITKNIFILGLFIIAWSRDEIEDELTAYIRLKGMALTFSWAVLYVLFTPIIYLVFKNPILDLSGQELVVSMLFVYLIMNFFQKGGR